MFTFLVNNLNLVSIFSTVVHIFWRPYCTGKVDQSLWPRSINIIQGTAVFNYYKCVHIQIIFKTCSYIIQIQNLFKLLKFNSASPQHGPTLISPKVDYNFKFWTSWFFTKPDQRMNKEWSWKRWWMQTLSKYVLVLPQPWKKLQQFE